MVANAINSRIQIAMIRPLAPFTFAESVMENSRLGYSRVSGMKFADKALLDFFSVDGDGENRG